MWDINIFTKYCNLQNIIIFLKNIKKIVFYKILHYKTLQFTILIL